MKRKILVIVDLVLLVLLVIAAANAILRAEQVADASSKASATALSRASASPVWSGIGDNFFFFTPTPIMGHR